MKIAIFTENFIGFKGFDLFSGAELVLFEICQTLLENNHEVTVFQVGDKNELLLFKGITVIKMKNKNYNFLNKIGITTRFHLYGLKFKKNFVVKNFDKIHFHYYFGAFPFAKENYTGMSHGIEWDDPDQYKIGLRNLRDRFSNYLMKKITYRNIKKMKSIVANDYNFLKFVESNFPLYRNKVEYIPNYVDTDLFFPMENVKSELKRKYPNHYLILIPKFITKARGQELFLEALSKLDKKVLKKIKVLLIGYLDPKSNYHKYILNLIKIYNLESNIHLLGHKDHFNELPQLINSVDLVAVPSYCREGTSLSVLEAMASRKLVLATNIGALPELVFDNYTGFISKPNPNDLAKKISEIFYMTQSERDLIANRGYEFCTSNFNKKLWAQKWLNFFENK